MRITEERLTEVLAGGARDAELDERNPVAALVVESTAAAHAAHPEQADEVREAGRTLCELLWPPHEAGPALTLPVAMHTFAREEHTPPAVMRGHLAQTAERDLLLGLSASALLRQPSDHRQKEREAGDSEPVLRTVYLLVRMCETQEETDALERAVNNEESV
jgi:hypothetical protein